MLIDDAKPNRTAPTLLAMRRMLDQPQVQRQRAALETALARLIHDADTDATLAELLAPRHDTRMH